MQKTLLLAGRQIEYTHKKSRRSKRLRLAIHPGGRVVVTTPSGATDGLIAKFAAQKAAWILKKIDEQKAVAPHDPAKSRSDYLQHKAAALKLAQDRAAHFAKIYGLSYGRITIKNAKSLWGSCSRKGNLNFNYKIALLPPALADYVIVHELCHLKEFNHSAKFWALVAQTIPDYARLRRQLKGNSLA